MDPDSFFSQLPDDIDEKYEATRTQRQFAFEERVIKRAFTECGIKFGAWGKLVNQCRDETGIHRLHFNWFNANYQFPARLCGRRIPRLHELTMRDLFKPSSQNRLFKAITKNLYKQEVDSHKAFVFVFPIVRKMFCAHNLDSDVVSGTDSVSWKLKTADGHRLIVEPTESLFNSVGSEWFFAA